MSGLTPEEKLEAQEIGKGLTDRHLIEGLQTLLERAAALLDGPLGEGENREITTHNIMVLAVAIVRIGVPDLE